MLLSDYITDVRDLLEEFPSPGVFWTDQQITRYVNKARDKVSLETMCCRSLATITAVQGQIPYNFSTVLTAVQNLTPAAPARAVAHIYNINFQWSTAFQPVLSRYPWSVLNARFLINPSIQSMIWAWGMYDYQSFYVWPPAPNNTYTMQCDVTYLPTNLVNPSDSDTAIPELIGRILVPLLACRWASGYRRQMLAMQFFEEQYRQEKNEITASLPHFVVPTYYNYDDPDEF